MKSSKKTYEIDMTHGSLIGKMLLFAIPLMASSMLQLLFNAMDVVVVGNFSGSQALAAVGSTGALTNLFVNLFIGFSVGSNVLVAQYFGAKDEKNVRETVHTSILLGLVGGVILIFAGVFLSKPLLELMDTPEDVLDLAALYMKIYFVGMPAMLVYNFGASILRAIGDTRRPLYYLTVAGVINICLNLLLVIVFDMSVAGVALATVISQCFSAGMILWCLIKSDGIYRLNLRELKFSRNKVAGIVRIGLPAGLQGALFSISNVLIQSSVNSFGSTVMAGNTAAGNLEGFVYMAMNSIHQTALSFVSQNVGAGQQKRLPKIAGQCMFLVIVIGGVLGNLVYYFGTPLLGIYTSDPAVIEYGLERMRLVCVPYFLCGMMDVAVGILRGMGYSIMPMLVSLAGACGLRIIWIYTVFQWRPTLFVLFLSYPITWAVTMLVHVMCFAVVWKRKKGHWAQIGQAGRAAGSVV